MEDHSGSTPITVRGRYLWKGDRRFFVRGVVYQVHRLLDPIAEDRLPQLERDVQLFKELGLNTIYVYSIDHTKPHDRVMKLLADAGIYVLTSVTTPTTAINRLSPHSSYNAKTISSFLKTVDAMAAYQNTLGILIGNSIVNTDATLSAAPVLKACARDVKRYMRLKHAATGQRVLPVGYAGARTGERDRMVLRYLASGRGDGGIDFWTCTDHLLPGKPDLAKSNYDVLADYFKHIDIPIFLSEYGGSGHKVRRFQETHWLFSHPMTSVFSGGCVYEFWQSANHYGLVEMLGFSGDSRSETRLAALTRAEHPEKVVQKRETGERTVVVYRDFVNYRESLKATRDVAIDWRDDQKGDEESSLAKTGAVESKWPWEPEFQEPDSCVDWEEVEVQITPQ